jgi:hypothetical protein
MLFEEVEDAISDAIKIGLGSSFDVGWDRRESRYRDGAHVRLRAQALIPIGRTEKRSRSIGGDLRERTYGVRRLVVQVQCEAQDQALGESAHYYADRVIAALATTRAEALLHAAELGCARMLSAPRAVPYPDEQGRWRSAVMFEVAFNTHSSFEDEEENIGHIRQVELMGDIDPTGDMGPDLIPPE